MRKDPKESQDLQSVQLFIGPQGLAALAEMIPKGDSNAKHSLP